MQIAVSLLAVVPMRKEPSHRSEMVSQLLFGEYVAVGEEKDGFVPVECLYDGYTGWVQANQLTSANEELSTTLYVNNWTDEVLVNGCRVNIPIGSPVYINAKNVQIGDKEISYQIDEGGVWNSGDYKGIEAGHLEKIYSRFLYTPYLWGGKSVFGIDCSGFVQQVFKMFGVKLLRDAYLQAEQGSAVNSLDEAAPGDLAFFQNEKGRVTHVGIVLQNNQIVHASGRVRIDTMDKEGIVNSENGKRTHYFHSIRRFF